MFRKSVLAFALALPLLAVDGKWTPQQVLQLDPAWLKKLGLELPPEKLWNPQTGTGLLAATVNIGGCSASFISETGLVATNHHCLFGILQEHATPQNDIITNGFLARSKGQELPSKTVRIAIPHRFTDVTREVEAAVPAGVDDLARQKAIDAKQKQIVAKCEERAFARCRVAAFDGGVQYVLVDTTELPDVRLVYAPPRAVGEYGGEIDNWMWPRHTGDFSIARAYVAPDGSPAAYSKDNVPYKPAFHLPIARDGVKPGDFVMVLGYPGVTFRSLTAAEMAERRELFYPRRVDLYGEYIRTMEEMTKSSPEGTIAVASNLKGLHNRYKNAQGQIAGLDRGCILEKQRAAEEEVAQWAKMRPEFAGALAARDELLRLVGEQRRTWERDHLLTEIAAGAAGLSHAATVVRSAYERQKPNADRELVYMDRQLPRLKDRLDREQKNYYIPVDKALFAAWVRRALALPADQRIAAVDAAFVQGGVPARIEALYAATKVTDREERLQMLAETPEQLRARKDAMLDFAFGLETERQELKARQDRQDGASARLRPQWRKAVLAHAGKPVAPDANSTLRVTFAHVKGYVPRDGVFYTPQTTLKGVLEKHTGEEAFNAPQVLRDVAAGGRYDNLPVNFLSDADTTGGNSGSPTVNGRGELVGLNFDRVWENVANDFGYNPEIARNVNVDVRYLLWMLENVSGAKELLGELMPAGKK
ncbi:MAG TPA: S46 family peptidase [Bryobacteraceae bacterium]|nr:S46 family peptidase [Bryobacteraceae bacterium]